MHKIHSLETSDIEQKQNNAVESCLGRDDGVKCAQECPGTDLRSENWLLAATTLQSVDSRH